MKEDTLAILIPAYKPDFLREAIESILGQSNQHFILYIFDDASPHELNEIVRDYLNTPNVIYHRFNENLGQNSLTKQWQRCIEFTKSEPWIWLFSDDDLMGEHCVEFFYSALKKYTDADIFRFKSQKISVSGEILKENEFHNPLTAQTFLQKKLSYDEESYMVESPFRRSLFYEIGGFPELPLAWAADDLFYVKMYNRGKAIAISDEVVKWRYSNENVSGKKSRESAGKKMEASLIFVNEIRKESKGSCRLIPENLPDLWYIRQIRSLTNQLSLFDEFRALYNLRGGLESWIHYLAMKWQRVRFRPW